MSFPILKAAFVVAAAYAAGSVPARAGGLGSDVAALTLKSTSIGLPDSSHAFPPGPGMDTVTANCVSCHSPGMILNQPNLPRAAWEGKVKKMINVYKAAVETVDIPTIAAYPATTKGS